MFAPKRHELCALLIGVYLCTLAVIYVKDVGACEDPGASSAAPLRSDVATAIERGKHAVTFDVASTAEVAAMVLLLVAGKRSRALATILLVDAIAVRARHIGVVSCTPHDTQCCSALGCYEFTACTSPPFLGAQTNWKNRLNYCPLPYFYYKDSTARLSCTSLSNTPDMASCYRYGCSSTYMPFLHYIHRIMLGTQVGIIVLSM